MTGQRLAAPAIALVAALSIAGMTTAQAKQQCSTAASSQGFWSWRMIDGRKCWYQGKPMLSKSMLEWPAETPAPADSNEEAASASPPPQMRHDPMDAQAYEPQDATTFEALWRRRIEMH